MSPYLIPISLGIPSPWFLLPTNPMCLSQGFLGRVHGWLVCSVLTLRQIGCITKAVLGKPPSPISAEEVCMLRSILTGFFPPLLLLLHGMPWKSKYKKSSWISCLLHVSLPQRGAAKFLDGSCFSQCEPTNILSCNHVLGKDKRFSWRPFKMSAGSECCSQRTASGH